MATYYENLERHEGEYEVQLSQDNNKQWATDRYTFTLKRSRATWDADPRAEVYLAAVELLAALLDDPSEATLNMTARMVRCKHLGNGVGEVYVQYTPNNAMGPWPLGPKHADGDSRIETVRVPNADGSTSGKVVIDDDMNPGWAEAKRMVAEQYIITESNVSSLSSVVLTNGDTSPAAKFTNWDAVIELPQTFTAYKISTSNYYIRIMTKYMYAKWLSGPDDIVAESPWASFGVKWNNGTWDLIVEDPP